MSNRNRGFHILFWSLLIVSFLILSCASKKPMWGDPQTGLILQYRIEKDQALNYNISLDQNSVMDIMGQSMETETDINLDFNMKCTEIDNQKNMITQVDLETLNITMDGMQGRSNINTSALIGKSFGMSLSPIGEKEFIDIESVPKINFGEMSGGERSIESFFSDILPQLSTEPVKVGESWIIQTEYDEPMGEMDLLVKLESNNMLDGLETIDGVECARIETHSTGTVSGSGSQGGMYMVFVGDLESTSTWYFAYKEGLFIKETVEQVLDAEIDLGDMGVLPMVMTDTLKMKLMP
ncbi:hypothetical protein JW824_01400 [bacterium]|nr:hypothetical protein [bacterium]RQV98556.1 MAG: hypothetical protein EH221_01790 [bacterium]